MTATCHSESQLISCPSPSLAQGKLISQLLRLGLHQSVRGGGEWVRKEPEACLKGRLSGCSSQGQTSSSQPQQLLGCNEVRGGEAVLPKIPTISHWAWGHGANLPTSQLQALAGSERHGSQASRIQLQRSMHV